MSLISSLAIIGVTSAAIYFSGNRFAHASSKVGDYLKLPKSVKGATLDAVSSSMPELMIALFSVLFFAKFEVGIGTITGSALYNLLVIPALCVLVAPKVFVVTKRIVSRDGMFYNISVFALLVALLYFNFWGIEIALVFLTIYAWYLAVIFRHTDEHKRNLPKTKPKKKSDTDIVLRKELIALAIHLLIIGVATFFLADAAIQLSEALNVPAVIVAFTIVAAATSLPDTIISITNARKGSIDDAASNVFGSNIFNILVALSVPLLIYSVFYGPVELVFRELEIVIGLLGSTILILYFLAEDHIIDRNEALFMLLMYGVFVAYTVFLSFNGG